MTDLDAERATARAAGEQLLDSLRRHLRGEPVDLEAACEATVAAVKRVASDRLAGEVAAAVRALLGRHASDRQFGADVAERIGSGRLWTVEAAIERALVVFDRQADLEAAEGELADLERQLRDRLAELEAAVAGVDIQAVLQLRPAVEVELPLKVNSARMTLADLQIARMEAERARFARRVEHKKTARLAADKAVADARRILDEATLELNGATLAEDGAKNAARETGQRLTQLRDQRASLAATIDDDQQRRIRRFAGLPDLMPTAVT